MRSSMKQPDPNLATVPDEPVGGLPASVEGWAVFLDLDGTLLDIAETPGAVVVSDRLRADLSALSRRTAGAVALITGRSVAFVDEVFPGHAFHVAGLHGAEWRDAEGRRFDCAHKADLAAALRMLAEKSADWPGVVVEDKGSAFAAHFRLVPQLEDPVRRFMESLALGLGERWMLQNGKSVVEIRPAGSDKGGAVERFMRERPFLGRRPLAVGDDLTDEAMFAVVNRLAGLSVRVGPASRPSAARAVVETPAAVREWIARVAR